MIKEKIGGGTLIDKGDVAYADFAYEMSYSAGTVGTRATQVIIDLSSYYSSGYKPISATIYYTKDSSSYIPIAMLFNQQKQALINLYRVTTSACDNANTSIRVFFIKE